MEMKEKWWQSRGRKRKRNRQRVSWDNLYTAASLQSGGDEGMPLEHKGTFKLNYKEPNICMVENHWQCHDKTKERKMTDVRAWWADNALMWQTHPCKLSHISSHRKQLRWLNLGGYVIHLCARTLGFSGCGCSSQVSVNLTLIWVFGDEHRNRVKLVVIAFLPTRHEESRVCGEGRGSEGMMEGGERS